MKVCGASAPRSDAALARKQAAIVAERGCNFILYSRPVLCWLAGKSNPDLATTTSYASFYLLNPEVPDPCPVFLFGRSLIELEANLRLPPNWGWHFGLADLAPILGLCRAKLATNP